jgi:hypothetical protein
MPKCLGAKGHVFLQKLNGSRTRERHDYRAEIALAIVFGWPKISVGSPATKNPKVYK